MKEKKEKTHRSGEGEMEASRRKNVGGERK